MPDDLEKIDCNCLFAFQKYVKSVAGETMALHNCEEHNDQGACELQKDLARFPGINLAELERCECLPMK